MKRHLRIYFKPSQFRLAYRSLVFQSDHSIGIRSRQLRPAVPANVPNVIKNSDLKAQGPDTTNDNQAIDAYTKMPTKAGQVVNNRPDNFMTSCWNRFEQTL